MGHTFFENRRKQHLEKKIAKLEARLRHTYTYIMTLRKDVQESEYELSKPLSEKDEAYWKRRKNSCESRINSSIAKAEDIQKRLDTLKKQLSLL